MRMTCEIPYRAYEVDLHPLFNGGVTVGNHRVYGDAPAIPVTGQTKPVAITLWREEGEGAVPATPELRKFLMTLNWSQAA